MRCRYRKRLLIRRLAAEGKTLRGILNALIVRGVPGATLDAVAAALKGRNA